MDLSLEQLRRELHDPLPHPDLDALRQITGQVTDWILHHFTSLSEQPIGQYLNRAAMEALLREPPPEDGQSFAGVFAEYQHKVAPNAFRVNHPRFLAFIPGAPTYLSVLGDMLCAGTNFFSGVWLEGAGPAQVELVVLDWFREFLGLPPDTRGIITSGGSEANLTALVVAREPLSHEQRNRAVLYLTGERHSSLDRAARIMGLHGDQIRPLPADDHFRLIPSALSAAVHGDREAGRLPWAVAANAGATNTGAVDPLTDLVEICRQQRLWLHVDAAYGWPAMLDPGEKTALAGIERADSVTLDPHKWFAQTFEAGCVLIREGWRLARAFAIRPDYMQDVTPADDEVNFADHGPALTRRFRALKIWLSVKVLGVRWFRRLIRHSCRLAELAEILLQRSGHFEILCPRQFSVVCFRYRPGALTLLPEQLDQLNLALVEELRLTGRAFLSSTRLHGRVALRFCFVNWRTTSAHVEEVVQLLSTLGERLEARWP
jgi:glutamate/tyrosine decarboxylase-like PLP-dependent enzyme